MLWRAYDNYEASLCPGCRQNLDECLLDEDTPEAERPHYEAGHRTCLSCAAVERAQIIVAAADEVTSEADEQVKKRIGQDPTKQHMRRPATPHARQFVAIRTR